MELRWLIICDKNGVKTDPTLQCWNEEFKEWDEVPYIECKDHEEEEYNHTEDIY